jgi:hypothetical protein
MGDDERLRLEYDQAAQLLRHLTEIRFKLLALVPTLSGAVVALVSAGRSGLELLAIGGLGLSATTGVLVYELRNGELRRRVQARARELEEALFGHALVDNVAARRLFGFLPVWHDVGLALVYGSALGGWAYLVAWGALKAGGMHGHARSLGLAVGVVAAVLVAEEVLRLDREARTRTEPAGSEPGSPTATAPIR